MPVCVHTSINYMATVNNDYHNDQIMILNSKQKQYDTCIIVFGSARYSTWQAMLLLSVTWF